MTPLTIETVVAIAPLMMDGRWRTTQEISDRTDTPVGALKSVLPILHKNNILEKDRPTAGRDRITMWRYIP